jgi:hypothetical protein
MYTHMRTCVVYLQTVYMWIKHTHMLCVHVRRTHLQVRAHVNHVTHDMHICMHVYVYSYDCVYV